MTLPCKKENCQEASKKFSQILRRRPRPKLGCGAKERKEELLSFALFYHDVCFCIFSATCILVLTTPTLYLF
jgi:hypothetical protein